MDRLEKIFKNKQYKQQLDQMSPELLKAISEDSIKALEVAQKGIEQVEPEKINEVEYLQKVADGIQKIAQKLLRSRAK